MLKLPSLRIYLVSPMSTCSYDQRVSRTCLTWTERSMPADLLRKKA